MKTQPNKPRHTDKPANHSFQSHPEFVLSICSPSSLYHVRKTQGYQQANKHLELTKKKYLKKTYKDCKLLKSPMAGEISPPRIKFDRFLKPNKKKKSTNINISSITYLGNPEIV